MESDGCGAVGEPDESVSPDMAYLFMREWVAFVQVNLTVETDVSGVWQRAKPELLACAERMRLAT